MNKSFNKRKNNNNKFDKSPENFKINKNNINNLYYLTWNHYKKKSKLIKRKFMGINWKMQKYESNKKWDVQVIKV